MLSSRSDSLIAVVNRRRRRLASGSSRVTELIWYGPRIQILWFSYRSEYSRQATGQGATDEAHHRRGDRRYRPATPRAGPRRRARRHRRGTRPEEVAQEGRRRALARPAQPSEA